MSDLRRWITLVERWETLGEAEVPQTLRQQVFYHGTSHDDAGRSILQNGIQPGNQGATARGHLIPVAGRTYLTSSLRYGIIYCIGGDMLGCSADSAEHLVSKASRDRTSSQYGWLFVIAGSTLVNDIQPDEDSVGEAAMYANLIMKGEETHWYQNSVLFQGLLKAPRDWLRYFLHNARVSMTKRQWDNAVFGEIAAQAAGGKRFLKVMNNTDKLNLIAAGAHIAYRGPITPDQAWRFDKRRACDLQQDGSNFFTLAERMR